MKFSNCYFLLMPLLILPCSLKAQNDTLTVGLTGGAPFVISAEGFAPDGIAVEIWQEIALAADIPYRFERISNVSTALDQLADKKLDIVAGPVSITSDRAKIVRFTQPYFLSSLVIVSNEGRETIL